MPTRNKTARSNLFTCYNRQNSERTQRIRWKINAIIALKAY